MSENSHSIEVERQRVRLHLVQDGSEPVNTIFVHGYMAVRDSAEREKVAHQLRIARIPGHVYILDWSAGGRDWVGPLVLPTGWFIRLRLAAAISWPLFLAAVACYGAGWAYHFKLHERRAAVLGDRLFTLLRDETRLREYRTNLVGHSLGVHVIYHALASRSRWHVCPIQDCVLLAGCSPLHPQDGIGWAKCASVIEGNVINVYSKGDGVLEWVPPYAVQRVGRWPIEGISNILNIRTDQYGHSTFVEELGHSLGRWWSAAQAPNLG